MQTIEWSMCFGNLSPIASRTSASDFADLIVGGREPAEVRHGLEVPNDDGRFHACLHCAQTRTSCRAASADFDWSFP
jgi:hypothetical protein